jgi:hypothetical protein
VAHGQRGLDLLRISRESLAHNPIEHPVQVRAPLAPLSDDVAVNPAAAGPRPALKVMGSGEPVVKYSSLLAAGR